jgi:hypothetical protein
VPTGTKRLLEATKWTSSFQCPTSVRVLTYDVQVQSLAVVPVVAIEEVYRPGASKLQATDNQPGNGRKHLPAPPASMSADRSATSRAQIRVVAYHFQVVALLTDEAGGQQSDDCSVQLLKLCRGQLVHPFALIVFCEVFGNPRLRTLNEAVRFCLALPAARENPTDLR